MSDFFEALKLMGQMAGQHMAMLQAVEFAYTKIYEEMPVEQLIYCVVIASTTPKAFESIFFEEVKSTGNTDVLSLGSETLAKIATDCIWKAVRARNLELTVLTTLQQGLVVAQKNCGYTGGMTGF